jgi:hypothetical protein
MSEHVENRYEVLVDVALAVRLPGVSSEIMAQIDASPRLEMALRKVCDAHESLLKSIDDTGFLEASMSASGIPAARALLAKLEESRKR